MKDACISVLKAACDDSNMPLEPACQFANADISGEKQAIDFVLWNIWPITPAAHPSNVLVCSSDLLFQMFSFRYASALLLTCKCARSDFPEIEIIESTAFIGVPLCVGVDNRT